MTMCLNILVLHVLALLLGTVVAEISYIHTINIWYAIENSIMLIVQHSFLQLSWSLLLHLKKLIYVRKNTTFFKTAMIQFVIT